jgi:Fe-S-cluster formation regulator IscX/YfhJ
MKNSTERGFDAGSDITELLIDEALIDTTMEINPKTDKYSQIRHKIEELLDERRLAEEFMLFDDLDF